MLQPFPFSMIIAIRWRENGRHGWKIGIWGGDFRHDRLWISFFFSFFFCVRVCMSLLNLLFFVPVLFFFFFSGLGFLSIIPWMDRHVFFVVVVGGGLSCHIFIFLSIYILFLLFSLVEGKWNSIHVEWFRFREMFVNHASSTPRWTLSVRYSQIKRQKNREIPKRAKQRRKEDEKKTKRRRKEAFVITSQRPNASVCVWPCVLVAAPYFSVSLVYRHRFFLGFYFLIPFEDGHQPCVLFLFSFFIFYLFFFFFFFFCRASAFTHGGSLRDGMTDRISTCLDWKR